MILDEKYRELAAVSNSTMKDFRKKGPKYYFDTYINPITAGAKEFSTESTDIGDLVDCLSTKGDFDKFYYISGDVKCSADVKAILDKTWQDTLHFLTTEEPVMFTYEEALKHKDLRDINQVGSTLVYNARNHVTIDKDGKEKKGYRSNYGDDALEKYLITEGANYYQDLGVANGRKILDQTTYNVAVVTKNSMMDDPTIGKLFNIENTKDYEVKFQFMVVVEINGVLCKILLDMCIFDHKNKIIYPKDVKTAMSHEQFRINYGRWDYPNQGSFYSGVLKAAYPGYKIAMFEFIVACTQSGEDPMIYKMSEIEIDVARNGARMKSGRFIEGWGNTISLIKWHMDTGQWRYPKEYYENECILLNTYAEEAIDAIGDGVDEADIF